MSSTALHTVLRDGACFRKVQAEDVVGVVYFLTIVKMYAPMPSSKHTRMMSTQKFLLDRICRHQKMRVSGYILNTMLGTCTAVTCQLAEQEAHMQCNSICPGQQAYQLYFTQQA